MCCILAQVDWSTHLPLLSWFRRGKGGGRKSPGTKGVKRNNGKDGKIELDELKNCSWMNGVNNEMHDLKYAKQKR